VAGFAAMRQSRAFGKRNTTGLSQLSINFRKSLMFLRNLHKNTVPAAISCAALLRGPTEQHHPLP
jgi:hypothetical protein